MAGTYELDDDEEQLILRRREELREYKFRQMKQLLCEHEWQWECAMHNDDAYKCRKCGNTKFE